MSHKGVQAIGNLYVIAAPSGTGKTTLVQALVNSIDDITVSISHTTREKRPGEIEGTNYYFVSKEEFSRMVDHNDFLEHAVIFDNFYGTSKSWVEKTLAQGKDVILEIDWQGRRQIKQLFPHSISIFILPPSPETLRIRLEHRNQDKPEVITERLSDARTSATHMHEFDYIVINDEFSQALQDIAGIIKTGRLLESRQTIKYADLIKKLERFGAK